MGEIEMSVVDLKVPWILIDEVAASHAVEELAREVGPLHPLRKKKVTAIARRQDCDDVLFSFVGEKSCAVVHLTYGRKEESDPLWPWTEIFESLDDWRERCMNPDHEDFTCE